MPSPTSLSLNHLRRHGFPADVVERWLPHANRRRDAFGFGDILAHVPDRLAKAKGRPELAAWLKAGGRPPTG